MPRPIPSALLLLLATTSIGCAAPLTVLFVGNSFTHGNESPVLHYNRTSITDANGTGHGGVPGIFQKLATEGGYAVAVTIEAVSGQALSYHVENKAAIIGAGWDWVVLQEHSTRPISTTDAWMFHSAVASLSTLARQSNPQVNILLYETWARPDYWPTSSQLHIVQQRLQTAYSTAAANNLADWAPVGDAFIHALDDGVAYNPGEGAIAGRVNLWASDRYHASVAGSYLSALVFYAKILGGDPRELPEGAGSAAAALGLGASTAAALQEIAWATVAAIPEPAGYALLLGVLALTSTAMRRRPRVATSPSEAPPDTP